MNRLHEKKILIILRILISLYKQIYKAQSQKKLMKLIILKFFIKMMLIQIRRNKTRVIKIIK